MSSPADNTSLRRLQDEDAPGGILFKIYTGLHVEGIWYWECWIEDVRLTTSGPHRGLSVAVRGALAWAERFEHQGYPTHNDKKDAKHFRAARKLLMLEAKAMGIHV